jgi:hypothetical protein
MQDGGQDASTSSANVSPTQIDFVRFLQKCASSPRPLKKHTISHNDASAFTSPELLADTLLNWDAGARLAGADTSQPPSWLELRAQLQQQGFPHDSLPHHMPYSSHADNCLRGILGDVLVQYSLRGQLVQQLIDTVEFASMHDSQSSLINGSNASAAHELSRTLETNQFRNFEEAAVQRATERSLRQQLRQTESDLQSCKERNRQLRSQVSDLEEEVHLMTRQLTKLRAHSTPAAAPSGNGRWERPQVPLFKLPSTASSPVHPAAAPATSQDLQGLVSENALLKQQIASLQTLYDELKQSTVRNQLEISFSAGEATASVHRASVAVETERSSKYFTEEMFSIFNVTDYNSCCRVARAMLQLSKAIPHLQSFADDVSEICRQFNPEAVLDSPEQIMQALRSRLSQLPVVHSSDNSRGTRQQLEQRSGLAVVSVVHSESSAALADESKATAHSGAFDGSNLVFFTGPQSEDSLAASPLLPPPVPAAAPAAAPAAVAVSKQRDDSARHGDASSAVVSEAMSLLGCSRPEDLLVSVEHLLVQSDELQHLRAVLSRRLDLTDPCAAFVDAELSSRHLQYAPAVESSGSSTCIKLRDPDEAFSSDAGGSGDRQLTLLDGPVASVQQSLAWEIVMHPARRPKPNLTSKPIAARVLHGQPKQPRLRDSSRRASSQCKQQHPQHAEAGFSQLLFANFKRRLLAQHSTATADLLSASRQQKSGSGQNPL